MALKESACLIRSSSLIGFFLIMNSFMCVDFAIHCHMIVSISDVELHDVRAKNVAAKLDSKMEIVKIIKYDLTEILMGKLSSCPEIPSPTLYTSIL